jgi:Enoyl-(Acyl carrier protein) reductase
MLTRTVVLSTADDLIGGALVAALVRVGAEVARVPIGDMPSDPGVPGVSAVVVRPPLPEPAPFVGTDPGEWYAEVDRALAPLHALVRATLPAVRASGDGRVVVVGAGWGAAVAGATARAAASGALVAYVKTLARELGRDGTTVNLVVEGERATAEHVAAAVAYLLGPGAGSVTGQLLTVGIGGEVRP